MLAESTADRKSTRFPRHRRLTLTETVLVEMLKENTGRALCDSGDAYGRNWQRNQGRDFLSEPATRLTVRSADYGDCKAEIDVTLNVFHWLNARVTYDPAMQRKFKAFCARKANRDNYDLTNMEAFAESRSGTYGEHPRVVNTYNGEDLLSQTLQYVVFTDAETDTCYVLLQIHGGCDVRGGYTEPKVFQVEDTYALYDNARAGIVETNVPDPGPELPGLRPPEEPAPYWSTDSGYHWYRDSACGLGAGRELQTYEVSNDPTDRGNGKIYVDPDGVAYGPLRGGKLEVTT